MLADREIGIMNESGYGLNHRLKFHTLYFEELNTMKGLKYYMNELFSMAILPYMWFRVGGTVLLWSAAFFNDNVYNALRSFDRLDVTALMLYFSPAGLVLEIMFYVTIGHVLNMRNKKRNIRRSHPLKGPLSRYIVPH